MLSHFDPLMVWRALTITLLLLPLSLRATQAAPQAGNVLFQETTHPDSTLPNTWAWQAGGNLADVFFTGSGPGWIVGSDGLLLHSTDAGATWFLQPSGTGHSLTATHFVNAQLGWAVGSGGVVQHTADGGASWLTQASGTTDDLNAVYFANDQYGWAAGTAGTIRRTSDGGVTWAAAASGTPAALHAVQFVDSQRGWIVGAAGTILHTTNGGTTWLTQVSGTDATFYSASFVDANRGWVVGRTEGGAFHGIILRTLDGGASWTSHRFSPFESLRAVHFADATHGWAVGGEWAPNEPWRALVLRTTDGGESWTADPIGPLGFQLHSVHFSSTSVGWAAGSWGGILGTTDGGVTWDFLCKPTGDTVTALRFANASQGWAIAQRPGELRPVGVILQTTHGGTSWSEQWVGRWLGSQKLNALDMIGATRGWAVGFDADEGAGLTLETTDGTSWLPGVSGTQDELLAVDYVDATYGWTLTRSNQVLRTTDGGASWAGTSPAGFTGLSAVSFVGPQRGWIVGASCQGIESSNACEALIKHSTDGGATWSTQATLANRTLTGLQMLGRQRGWTVGSAGTIVRTVDGTAWIHQNSGTSNDLAAVNFVGDYEGWAVGAAGTILHTLDAGATWVPYALPVKAGLRTVYFADAQHGWVGGDGGLILSYAGDGLGLHRAVANSLDDTCVQVGSGVNQVTSPILRLGKSSSYNYICGVRFTDITIPPGSQVVAASLALSAAGWQTGVPVDYTVYGEAANNAANFADSNQPANLRPRTAAAVPWTLTYRPDNWFHTPGLAAPLQEVVNRPGWRAGNALALLIVSDAGNRYYVDARAYDGGPAQGARLVVWYRPPGSAAERLWLPYAVR